ncbi:DUF3027 domain-containing protein [Streptomyces clavuligerus]|uniref:DUF3027 domain-containing protein n=1 Tax=Streptomyces clavuligerus TaxID=1901 RepID=UPI00018006F4|nr:DUF3027 domain-containing protein [Streptomyces clavuligerus]AXU13489.1 DUF3027 domain-containing protein [Streptomyces clavuligerus]EDY53268.1 conserved hypothetical protein [Streptomyces clavuligerus]MBY6303447.1 DUF3027 domain-containing protein [Streptomyces clavuligerus]QCS06272.1 DUF3027 domain-containing protein [Streptomyces clavuligerus]QPJ94373.1 DUF3027 domain-containing protein [Streptomyces clavuligerus]
MSAATTRSRTPDRLCAEAVDLARAAAQETAAPGSVGEHVSLVPEGDRVVTHFFDCSEPGYRGWRWAVTVARASRAKNVTVDESVLLPGPDALLAPEWVPWSERLRPGDLGPGDLLPTAADDPRLEPGYTGEDVPPPNSVIAETSHDLAERVEAEDAELTDRTPADAAGNSRGEIAALAEELGMRRARVLSRYGLRGAADRWDEAFGERTPMAQAAPASCASCGFLVPVAGSLRQAFGICANEFAPADGRVVSLSYGCGGHSEAAVMPKPPQPAPPVLDSLAPDAFPLDDAGPDEDLGHA